MVDTMIAHIARVSCRNSSHAPNGTCAAICMDEPGDVPARGCRHAERIHGDRVRTIIKAMREPTETMIEAAGPGSFGFSREIVQQNAVAEWQAMIDAILEEGRGG